MLFSPSRSFGVYMFRFMWNVFNDFALFDVLLFFFLEKIRFSMIAKTKSTILPKENMCNLHFQLNRLREWGKMYKCSVFFVNVENICQKLSRASWIWIWIEIDNFIHSHALHSINNRHPHPRDSMLKNALQTSRFDIHSFLFRDDCELNDEIWALCEDCRDVETVTT